ncbi:MAG: SCP2 sterol-binding domain-containing protein, partial [Deltaproteobacteria bacterium]|nr:SCP2 sterol-binding domain-containing protein [Deltaproteobacteria bacterium]
AIINGELNGQMAFMSGKLKVQGDMMLAMKLGSILGS